MTEAELMAMLADAAELLRDRDADPDDEAEGLPDPDWLVAEVEAELAAEPERAAVKTRRPCLPAAEQERLLDADPTISAATHASPLLLEE